MPLKKLDPTVRRETAFVALGTVILSVLMEAVFLVIGKWNLTVLFGNLLGAFVAVLNFFLLGLTVQAAVSLEEKDAKARMTLSQRLRLLLLAAAAILGIVLPCFDAIAAILPLFFPRLVLGVRAFTLKKEEPSSAASSDGEEKESDENE